VGKHVIIACFIEPLRTIEENKINLYWYRIRDQTGEGVLTSYSKISAGKSKISAYVKKTKTGSLYLLFDKML